MAGLLPGRSDQVVVDRATAGRRDRTGLGGGAAPPPSARRRPTGARGCRGGYRHRRRNPGTTARRRGCPPRPTRSPPPRPRATGSRSRRCRDRERVAPWRPDRRPAPGPVPRRPDPRLAEHPPSSRRRASAIPRDRQRRRGGRHRSAGAWSGSGRPARPARTPAGGRRDRRPTVAVPPSPGADCGPAGHPRRSGPPPRRPRRQPSRAPPRGGPNPGRWDRSRTRPRGRTPPGGRSPAAPAGRPRSSGGGDPALRSARHGRPRRRRTDRRGCRRRGRCARSSPR